MGLWTVTPPPAFPGVLHIFQGGVELYHTAEVDVKFGGEVSGLSCSTVSLQFALTGLPQSPRLRVRLQLVRRWPRGPALPGARPIGGSVGPAASLANGEPLVSASAGDSVRPRH